MGKRVACFSAVKKTFSRESEKKREKRIRKSVKWFGKSRSVDLDSFSAGSATVVPEAQPPKEEEVKLIQSETNEENSHAYSVALATTVAAEAAAVAAQAAAEVVRLTAAARKTSKTKEETSAIKIQTAFRSYLARRALKALRGLVRLKTSIGDKPVQHRATTTINCMQTMARLQSEIRARKINMSEENSSIQQEIQQKKDEELEKYKEFIGENWDDSTQSKEQIEANNQSRQEATTRRERALAYAYSHQQTWRNSPNSLDQMYTDPNNPHGGWSWLERWMAARPWENVSAVDHNELNTDRTSVTSTTRHSISSKRDTKSKIHSPKAQKQIRSPNRLSTSTTNSKVVTRKYKPSSPRGTTCTDDDSRSMNSFQSERCRRHSVTGSSLRDDESLSSSPAVPGYMVPTESARAKSRLGLEKIGTPERVSVSSAKKRLSYTGSPAGPRRQSGATKIDLSPIKDITAN
ncbi:hypothetical protein ACJIZ3_006007 [Penstemon smallii]|uniref:Uncharacterized protein n=1 Tax=Penstemon smallii TaxID=265156 RepID=A0ABD3S6S7_9LAMI